jgi:hypothetical protein
MAATPQMARVSVFNGGRWESRDWPPEDLAGAVAWFAGKLAEVPPEHRGTAVLEIDSEQEYDSHHARICIEYRRLETQEEAQAREEKQRRFRASVRERELKQLRDLRARYPEEK